MRNRTPRKTWIFIWFGSLYFFIIAGCGPSAGQRHFLGPCSRFAAAVDFGSPSESDVQLALIEPRPMILCFGKLE